MGTGGCIRSHAGGTDADDGVVLLAEKALATNNVTRAAQRFNGSNRCSVGHPYVGMPLLRLQYRADEGEAYP